MTEDKRPFKRLSQDRKVCIGIIKEIEKHIDKAKLFTDSFNESLSSSKKTNKYFSSSYENISSIASEFYSNLQNELNLNKSILNKLEAELIDFAPSFLKNNANRVSTIIFQKEEALKDIEVIMQKLEEPLLLEEITLRLMSKHNYKTSNKNFVFECGEFIKNILNEENFKKDRSIKIHDRTAKKIKWTLA